MRVIAGEFRSRALQAPRGMATRPTSDRLRETLFNVLQPRFQAAQADLRSGLRFLDLYAGSGANGLEALSRGAVESVFVEQAAPALAAIRGNVAALGLAGRARVEGVAALRWLGNAVRGGVQPFDIVFLDPPYADAEAYTAMLELLGGEAASLLAPGAVMVAEHRRALHGKARKGLLQPFMPGQQYGLLTRTRLLEQGDAALSFYTREPMKQQGSP